MERRSLGFDVNPLGTAIFIVQVVFLALAWITFLIRAFVKVALLKKVQIDDYVMLLAVVRIMKILSYSRTPCRLT